MSSEQNNNFSNTTSGQQTMGNNAGGQERQDWLDKGIQGAGEKAGVNISNQNADKAGDFANKEVKNKEGFNLPGVH
ncbi:hypothetical protein K474DRAFT_1705817 [Panus rudis PR-1116 ss-1]|nr:hypothetical protein K474DRAFT_1705817 [Panus rudis PR-1116 ss-1]